MRFLPTIVCRQEYQDWRLWSLLGGPPSLYSPGQLDWMQRRTKLLPPSEGSRDLGSACCRRTDETMGRGDLVTQLAELAIQNTASQIGSSALYGCPSLPNSPILQWEETKTEYARDQSDVTKLKTVIYVWSPTYSHRSKTRPRGPAPVSGRQGDYSQFG